MKLVREIPVKKITNIAINKDLFKNKKESDECLNICHQGRAV
jgi:hypothetical protein